MRAIHFSVCCAPVRGTLSLSHGDHGNYCRLLKFFIHSFIRWANGDDCPQALRNMAFGSKRPSGKQQQQRVPSGGQQQQQQQQQRVPSGGQQQQQQQRQGSKGAKPHDWEDWQRRDTEVRGYLVTTVSPWAFFSCCSMTVCSDVQLLGTFRCTALLSLAAVCLSISQCQCPLALYLIMMIIMNYIYSKRLISE